MKVCRKCSSFLSAVSCPPEESNKKDLQPRGIKLFSCRGSPSSLGTRVDNEDDNGNDVGGKKPLLD